MKKDFTVTVLVGAFRPLAISSSDLPITKEPLGINSIPKGFSENHFCPGAPINSPFVLFDLQLKNNNNAKALYIEVFIVVNEIIFFKIINILLITFTKIA
jgi:hypothetical protein